MEDPLANAVVSPVSPVADDFSGTEGVYLLPHHQEEIERLQRQHEFIKASNDGALTNVNLPDGAKVLDSGCADGTWLLDLVRTINKADLKLHGMDLGSTLFRSDPKLDLRKHNVTRPVPDSWGWKETFDLVHQRLLVWGIGKDEWPAVVSNLATLLKPGGTLQLAEVEWVLPESESNAPQQAKLGHIQEWSCNSSGMDVHIWKRLPGILEELGFTDIGIETFDLGYGATSKRVEDRTWTAEMLTQSFQHLARKMPDDAISSVAKTPADYLIFLDELTKEMKAIGYTPKMKWITGKKP